MRIVFIIYSLVCAYALKGQSDPKFGLLLNFGQCYNKTIEMNLVYRLPNPSFQILGAFNVLHSYTNHWQSRNKLPFNSEFMKKRDDEIKGFGWGIRLRYLISDLSESKWKIFTEMGCNFNQNNVKFFENEYNIDQTTLYHYALYEHNVKYIRVSPTGQFILNYSPNVFFFEFGAGITYFKSIIPDSLESYRNYHENIFDYGYSGFCPSVSLRFGAWLF